MLAQRVHLLFELQRLEDVVGGKQVVLELPELELLQRLELQQLLELLIQLVKLRSD